MRGRASPGRPARARPRTRRAPPARARASPAAAGRARRPSRGRLPAPRDRPARDLEVARVQGPGRCSEAVRPVDAPEQHDLVDQAHPQRARAREEVDDLAGGERLVEAAERLERRAPDQQRARGCSPAPRASAKRRSSAPGIDEALRACPMTPSTSGSASAADLEREPPLFGEVVCVEEAEQGAGGRARPGVPRAAGRPPAAAAARATPSVSAIAALPSRDPSSTTISSSAGASARAGCAAPAARYALAVAHRHDDRDARPLALDRRAQEAR